LVPASPPPFNLPGARAYTPFSLLSYFLVPMLTPLRFTRFSPRAKGNQLHPSPLFFASGSFPLKPCPSFSLFHSPHTFFDFRLHSPPPRKGVFLFLLSFAEVAFSSADGTPFFPFWTSYRSLKLLLSLLEWDPADLPSCPGCTQLRSKPFLFFFPGSLGEYPRSPPPPFFALLSKRRTARAESFGFSIPFWTW